MCVIIIIIFFFIFRNSIGDRLVSHHHHHHRTRAYLLSLSIGSGVRAFDNCHRHCEQHQSTFPLPPRPTRYRIITGTHTLCTPPYVFVLLVLQHLGAALYYYRPFPSSGYVLPTTFLRSRRLAVFRHWHFTSLLISRPTGRYPLSRRYPLSTPVPVPESSQAMSGKVLLTEDPAYKALADHFRCAGSSLNIRSLFANDSGRFDKFRWEALILDLGSFLTFFDVDLWHRHGQRFHSPANRQVPVFGFILLVSEHRFSVGNYLPVRPVSVCHFGTCSPILEFHSYANPVLI